MNGKLTTMRILEAVVMTGRQTDRQSIGQARKQGGMYGRSIYGRSRYMLADAVDGRTT